MDQRIVIGIVIGCLGVASAAGADKADAGLVSFVPPEAIVFVERSGHSAVRKAFLASEFGAFGTDEAILQFVRDSRINIGKLIMRELHGLRRQKEIDRQQKLLHEFLRPFWYERSIGFLLSDADADTPPGWGVVCVPGKHAGSARAALEKLMAHDTVGAGEKGKAHLFTVERGGFRWTGVARGDQPWTLPEDPDKLGEALKGKKVLLAAFPHPMILLAGSLDAAEKTARGSGQEKAPGRMKKIRRVLDRTAMDHWAIRWYVDAGKLRALIFQEDRKASTQPSPEARAKAATLELLGLDRVEGLGGHHGYADKLYTARVFVDIPKGPVGLPAVLADAGYLRANALVPSEAPIRFAAKLNVKTLATLLGGAEKLAAERGGAEKLAAERGGEEAAKKLTEQMRPLHALLNASDGRAVGFLSALPAMGMMGAGGPPVAAVVGVKDRKAARKALDALAETLKGSAEGRENNVPDTYRKHEIRVLGSGFMTPRATAMDDRLILGFSDAAIKSAIDAALDETGGFEKDSDVARYAEVAGKGSVLVSIDVAALAKLGWPLLMQASQEASGFPFRSLPGPNKMVRMLGPSVVLVRPAGDGLMMTVRGKVPLAGELSVAYPFAGALAFMGLAAMF